MVKVNSVLGAVLMVAATLAMSGANCDPPGCAGDLECGTGQYCRNSDASCQVLGDCNAAADCAEQNLTHIQCAGSWACSSNACDWNCSVMLPGMGEQCGANDACAAGLDCVHYYGIAGPNGPEFSSCEKTCSNSSQCGADASCVTIADGPGQVCRARDG